MKTRFQVRGGVRFTCSRCGDCCRGWNVALGPGEVEVLEALDWRGKVDALVGQKPTVRARGPGAAGRARLKRRGDGACVFLGDADQCLVHEHFGAATKPLLCRLYPFGFYPLGDQVGVDVSFFCRAVSEGRGAPIGERIPEWTRMLDATAAAGEAQGRHRLRRGVDLPADVLWELEHHLLGFVEDRSLDLFGRVRAMLQYVKVATTGDPAAPTAAPLRQAMAAGIPAQIAGRPAEARMDKTQRAIFYQWLFLHLNPPPHDVHDWPAAEQEAEKNRRLQAGRRFLDRRGNPWVDNRELGVSFKDVAKVEADVLGTKAAKPLETYLAVKLLGQRFLVVMEKPLPFVEAVPKFLLVVPMTLWTAKALAAERGAPRVEEADLRRALRLVDRTLGTFPTSALPKKQAEACDFVMLETDLVEAAIADLVRKA